MPHKPLIDIYARISRDSDGSGIVKCDDQVEDCLLTLDDRDSRPGMIFRDNSLSAWNPKITRPDFERLMHRLETGQSDGVIVYDLSRFTRKPLEGERLLNLARQGIKVWSISTAYNLNTADGIKQFRDHMTAAAFESDKISERVKRGHLRRMRKGKPHGGPRAFGFPGYLPKPEGWQKGDDREPIPAAQIEAERQIIRTAYERLLHGATITAVVSDLNHKGIKTSAGNAWSRASLIESLTRPAVAGFRQVKVNGQLVEIETEDPIVSREDWEALRSIIDGRRQRGRPRDRHPLSGLIHCGSCGRPLDAFPRKDWLEYRCRRDADRGGCGRTFVRHDWAMDVIGEAVKVRLSDAARLQAQAAQVTAQRERRTELSAEIRTLEDTKEGLADKIADWGFAAVDRAIEKVNEQLIRLRRELDQVDGSRVPYLPTFGDPARAWDKALARHDHEKIKMMVRTAFPRLTLLPAKARNDLRIERWRWDG